MDILIAIVALCGLTAVVLGTIGSFVKTYDEIMQEIDQ